ncbi:extracellular solute-binding protein [Halobellus captivus]|uniref:extracellular solute-binding protein n=1 Tax=Halobellus captivus TaxID=2592614 RepID=UPI0011A4BA6E|nr:extracellular solute-binding protein [Halobellus captivus]
MNAGPRRLGRRAYIGGLVTCLGGLSGCAGVVGSAGGRSDPVSILAAGSLTNAFEHGLRPSLTTPVQVETHGSARIARMVADGQKDPDILAVADAALFDGPVQPSWFAEFATNSLVVAYNPDSEGGRRIADAGAGGWFRPMVDGLVSLGRTDPDLDPLGYRTLFLLELASDYYETDVDLREAIPSREQRYPETQLVSQFETGGIDAAFTYRNMAVERDYEFVSLPSAIDLSDPTRSDEYASARYTLPSGKVVTGSPISYASVIRNRDETITDVFTEQIAGEYLREFGFSVPDTYPQFTGNVPDTIID